RRAAADARCRGAPGAVQAGLRPLFMNIRELACFQRVNWSPDSSELRWFAGAMLAGFAVLGMLRALRHHGLDTGVVVLWGIGVALALGAMVPKLGRAVYLAVYVPASLLGFCMSRAVLTLVFYLVFLPLGLALRLLRKDLLDLRPVRGRSVWVRHAAAAPPNRYYRQF